MVSMLPPSLVELRRTWTLCPPYVFRRGLGLASRPPHAPAASARTSSPNPPPAPATGIAGSARAAADRVLRLLPALPSQTPRLLAYRPTRQARDWPAAPTNIFRPAP